MAVPKAPKTAPYVLADGQTTYGGSAGNDFIQGNGGPGNRAETISGNGGDDYIDGRDGNDYLLGNAGNDVLIGANGHDTLAGGGNNDYLSGGNGQDALSGDTGADTLTGGNGVDAFLFNTAQAGSAANADIVTDFQAGESVVFFGTQAPAGLGYAQAGDDVLLTSNGILVATFENALAEDVAAATSFSSGSLTDYMMG